MSRDAWTPTPEHLILVRRNLTDYFSDDELSALCSEMGVDYERLRGQSKAVKASELARHLAARRRIQELVARASQLRPDVSWGDIPVRLAAEADRGLERPAPSSGIGPTFRRLGWLVAVLVIVAGLVFVLGGGLRWGGLATAPGPASGTPGPAPTTSTPAMSTPTPAVAAITATSPGTPSAPTGTATPTTMATMATTMATMATMATIETPDQTATRTPTPRPMAGASVPRVVTPLAPLDNACEKSPVITFKWTGAALRPGESFLVAIEPSEVKRAECSGNYFRGVQYSPPLKGYEWTVDISAPPQVPAACAGPIEWMVYIRSAAGNVTQAGPIQHFLWNPSGCSKFGDTWKTWDCLARGRKEKMS